MPIPNGKDSVSAYVDEGLAIEVQHLAEECGLSRSRYVTALLVDAVRRRRAFRFKKGEYLEEKPSKSEEKSVQN